MPAPTQGILAETKQRDQRFVMKGHHCHDCYELFYVESGDCRFLVDEHIFDLHAGDFILVPPRTLHYTRYVFGPCKRTIVLFREEDVAEEVRRCMPRAAGFSPNYMSRKFRMATGIGLHEYIVFVSLQHAAQELASTTDSITTIALRCGFSDSNYFKDSFKKKYGVTPRSYRKNL